MLQNASNEDNAALLEAVNASGKAFLVHTDLGGRYTLRMAIGACHTQVRVCAVRVRVHVRARVRVRVCVCESDSLSEACGCYTLRMAIGACHTQVCACINPAGKRAISHDACSAAAHKGGPPERAGGQRASRYKPAGLKPDALKSLVGTAGAARGRLLAAHSRGGKEMAASFRLKDCDALTCAPS